MEMFAVLFIWILIISVCGIASLISIADYVLSALSLQRIANRRLIAKSWLAWIPVANSWALGCIADDYDATLGFRRSWRKVLLYIAIAVIVGIVGMVAVYFALYGFMFTGIFVNELGAYSGDGFIYLMLIIMLALYAYYVLVLVLATAFNILKVICLFKVYESLVPEKAVLYIVLSIVVPLAGSICLFLSRDKGYRRELELPINEDGVEENDIAAAATE